MRCDPRGSQLLTGAPGTWYTHLQVVAVHVAGQAAVLVHQEAETPLLFKQCLLAAVCNEFLDFTLARSDGLHVLGKQATMTRVWHCAA